MFPYTPPTINCTFISFKIFVAFNLEFKSYRDSEFICNLPFCNFDKKHFQAPFPKEVECKWEGALCYSILWTEVWINSIKFYLTRLMRMITLHNQSMAHVSCRKFHPSWRLWAWAEQKLVLWACCHASSVVGQWQQEKKSWLEKNQIGRISGSRSKRCSNRCYAIICI